MNHRAEVVRVGAVDRAPVCGQDASRPIHDRRAEMLAGILGDSGRVAVALIIAGIEDRTSGEQVGQNVSARIQAARRIHSQGGIRDGLSISRKLVFTRTGLVFVGQLEILAPLYFGAAVPERNTGEYRKRI